MMGVAVQLREWGSKQPEVGSPLAGRSLSPGDRGLAQRLKDTGRLEVLELAQGLELRASSWVGRVVLGDLTITIQPKITGAPLLRLLRYAYRLRDLDLFQDTNYATSERSFQDLICQQLAAEVRELLAHGLHQDYERIEGNLASPRGRLDFPKYVRRVGVPSATLPCVYHPRTEATLLNQMLLAGVRLAVGASNDLDLKGMLRRLARQLEGSVAPAHLDGATLREASDRLDRRTASYQPALTLIGLHV